MIVPLKLAVSVDEAADSLGMSVAHFKTHVLPSVRIVVTGDPGEEVTSIMYADLQRWADRNGKPEPPPRRTAPQAVYFAVLGPIVKIGVSAGPQKRVDSYHGAVMVASEAGGRGREQQLHAAFAEHHATREWFHLATPVRAYIEALPTFTGWPS